MRETLPDLGDFDACVTAPPYGETSLRWDRWVDGWPTLLAERTSRMWCFGTLGMFMDHAAEFAGWRRPRSIVWEKHNGSNFAKDFFNVVHELGGYFYRGPWGGAHEGGPRAPRAGPDKRGGGGPGGGRRRRRGGGQNRRVRPRRAPPHPGGLGAVGAMEAGPRLLRSV